MLSLAGLGGWSATSALAHPMPESQVWVDTRQDGLHLTLLLPLNRLELSFGSPLASTPQAVLAQHGEALSRYLLQHVGARSQGLGWQVLRPKLSVVSHEGNTQLQAEMRLRAPPGTDPRSVVLHYDVITHEVLTHRVLVAMRNDWEAGRIGDAPHLLGELHHGKTTLALPFEDERPGASILRLVLGGAWHIAEGNDHLLFLVMLLVIAPLRAQGGHWQGVRPLDHTLRDTAWLVTAFTMGHTITLVLGSYRWLTPDTQHVEVAVALTVGLAACHALRPLLRHADALAALLFGLVHGMAFSASLSGAGLTVAQHAMALLAFNVGIELAQLGLLAMVLPPLILLARRKPRLYRGVRLALASMTLGCALYWAAERLGWIAVPDGPWADALSATGRWLLLPLWLAGAWAWRRGAQPRAGSGRLHLG